MFWRRPAPTRRGCPPRRERTQDRQVLLQSASQGSFRQTGHEEVSSAGDAELLRARHRDAVVPGEVALSEDGLMADHLPVWGVERAPILLGEGVHLVDVG